MTNNQQRATQIINTAHIESARDLKFPNPRALARALADAGLLAPDLPEPYLHPVTGWQAKCSQCGYIQDDYGDFTAMDAVGVVEEVLAGGWVLEDDRLVCDSCQGKEADHADA